MAKEKPPTIRVGVSGIDAAKQKGDEGFAEPSPIDWRHICGLPPFQMFVAEKAGKPLLGMDSLIGFICEHDENALHKEYCAWHKAKGYWPNEDPMGRLIDGN